MAPRRRKDGQPPEAGRGGREGPPREAADAREEEGFSQPGSSAQKPPRRPEGEAPPGHPE